MVTPKNRPLQIVGLKTNHLVNPLGIDEVSPRFSWKMNSEEQGKSQTSYRILVATTKKQLDKGDYFWDSGKIEGSTSTGITYTGTGLSPRTRYYWKVQVWDEKNQCVESREDAYFETGLMGEQLGGAKWISSPENVLQQEIPFEDVSEFVIEYEMELQGTVSSFLFGAAKGRYGDVTMCEIDAGGEAPVFTVRNMKYLSKEQSDEVSVTFSYPEDNKYRVYLSVGNGQMTAEVNGNQLGTFSIETDCLGSIGYYSPRGSANGYLDNILVTDKTGTSCYSEDFEQRETIFTPYYHKIESGRLILTDGVLLTKGFEQPSPIFRREFSVDGREIASARIYMTALGSFDLFLNGNIVSEDYLSPGKLLYNQYLNYVTYDVTSEIISGNKNVWGIQLYHGWYDRAVGYPEIWAPWGNKNGVYGALMITYQDGTQEVIPTDELFQVYADGPIRSDDIYQGEIYDARKQQNDFSKIEYNAEGWYSAETDAIAEFYDDIPLYGKSNEPVRCIQELSPVAITEPADNIYVVDFGQNFAGTYCLKFCAQEGQTITIRSAEEINTGNFANADDVEGTIWTENLLTAAATDYYTAIEGEQTYEPRSVYHGFRYLQIEGLKEAPSAENIKGIVLSSDLEQTGGFECSNEQINKYFNNVLWSQKSNFFDNPTDCPQRDERHGWAGDAQIFSKTACYNSNCYSFFDKYLKELCRLQTENGSFPDMAPRNFGTDAMGKGGAGANNCWGDAAVILTWNLYLQYGDKAILEENYEALCRWVDMLESTSEHYIRYAGGYGDHLSLESTPQDLSDTAWCANSARLVAEMSGILGKTEEQQKYTQIYESFKRAWQDNYVAEDGSIECYTQTAYVLGLAFDLFPEDKRVAAAECLRSNILFNQYELHTGYSGIGYIFPVLSDAGFSQDAYLMMENTNENSLLYPVTCGATTTPEALNTYGTADGKSIRNGSLNHYAYGAPTEWLYTHVLGIQADSREPGFKHFYIRPEVDDSLSYAKGYYESMYGRIEVCWERKDGKYHYEIRIPANSSATVELQGMEMMELESGYYSFVVPKNDMLE